MRQLRSEVNRWAVFCDHQVDVDDLSAELRSGSPHDPRDHAIVDASAGADLLATGALRPDSGRRQPRPDRGRSAPTDQGSSSVPPLAETVAEAERIAIERALAACRGNIARTASLLGVQRNTLKRKLRSFGLYPSLHEM